MLRKKLLSLGLAGAMVASTGVPAFAQTISGAESQTLTGQVQINGSVSKADGTAPAGRIEVELPTSMAFSVDKDGAFISSSSGYEIKNKSSVGVELAVQQFNETNTSGGITVKPEGDILANKDTLDRSNVSLKLVAGTEEVDLATVNAAGAPSVLGTIQPSSSLTMNLVGEAGGKIEQNPQSGVDKDGTSEDFTVVFQVKKA